MYSCFFQLFFFFFLSRLGSNPCADWAALYLSPLSSFQPIPQHYCQSEIILHDAAQSDGPWALNPLLLSSSYCAHRPARLSVSPRSLPSLILTAQLYVAFVKHGPARRWPTVAGIRIAGGALHLLPAVHLKLYREIPNVYKCFENHFQSSSLIQDSQNVSVLSRKSVITLFNLLFFCFVFVCFLLVGWLHD